MDVTWERWALEADAEFVDEEVRTVVELARAGATIYARTLREGREPSVEIKRLTSDAAAIKSLATRAAKLRKDGYLPDGTTTGPLPAEDTREARAVAQKVAVDAGKAKLDAGVPAFVAAWRAQGYDPVLGFAAQGQRSRQDPNAVAAACLDTVERVFGMGPVRYTTSYDEHGKARKVPYRDYAAFYQRPAHVLAVVREVLQGKFRGHDDEVAYGFADEVEARMRALASE